MQDTLDNLKQYCYYNGKLVWSPAKITQICLSYMDDTEYLDKIIEYIKENYEEELEVQKQESYEDFEQIEEQ